jgi:nitrate reductase beta subunit
VQDPAHLLESQLSIFLDPHDPEVQAAARAEGIADDWIEAATRSPVYKLAVDWRIALPLHPEYRTLPMVWYVPPLSPIDGALAAEGYDTDPDDVFPAIERMRIPVEYLANLLSAGDADVIRRVLRRLAAMRGVMRALQLGGEPREELAHSVGLDVAELEAMYRLLAIAKYDDRYVIPKAHTELAARLEAEHAGCSLDEVGGPGGYGAVGYPTQRKLPEGKRLKLIRENR